MLDYHYDVNLFAINSLWFAYDRLIKPLKIKSAASVRSAKRKLTRTVRFIEDIAGPVTSSEQGVMQIIWQKAFTDRLKIFHEWEHQADCAIVVGINNNLIAK